MNKFYQIKLKEANSFIERMFSEMGFNTYANYSEKLNEEEDYRIYEFSTKLDIDNEIYYRINIFNNLFYNSNIFEEKLVIFIRFGRFGNSLEIEKTFEIQDRFKNLEFIKETVVNHYEKFMK